MANLTLNQGEISRLWTYENKVLTLIRVTYKSLLVFKLKQSFCNKDYNTDSISNDSSQITLPQRAYSQYSKSKSFITDHSAFLHVSWSLQVSISSTQISSWSNCWSPKMKWWGWRSQNSWCWVCRLLQHEWITPGNMKT